MPQIIKSIKRFGGLYLNPAQEDIPDNASAYNVNVDPHATHGRLTGIPVTGQEYLANVTSIPDVFQGAWIKYDSGGVEKWDLVYIDINNNDIKVIEDFYAAVGSRTFTSLVTAPTSVYATIKTFNNAVQIGVVGATPYAVYRLISNKAVFNDADNIDAGVYAESGYLPIPSTSPGGIELTADAVTDATAGGYFQADVMYSWAITIVYDGLQESGFSEHTEINTGAVSYTEMTLTMTADDVRNAGAGDITQMDSRVTAVKLWRAESSDANVENLGLYRLVKTIDINHADWTASTDDFTLAYADVGGYPEGGATYEKETGIAETLQLPYVNYKLNEVGGGYHWMTKTFVPGSTAPADWDRYIFRSKKFRPNMVDWADEDSFVICDEIPTAMAYYESKLYVFGLNKVYRYHSELMIEEDSFEGVGVSGQQAVTVTEFGMFFSNRRGAYRIFNGKVDVISDAIYRDNPVIAAATGWKTFVDYALDSGIIGKLMAFYIPLKRVVLFLGQDPTAVRAGGFAYYLPTGEWYWWYQSSLTNLTANSGAFSGKDGELFYSNSAGTYEVMGGGTFESFDWASKEFDLGEPSQNKDWNKIIWDSSGTVVTKYATNGSDPTSGTTATSGANINTYAKTFQIYLDCTTSAYVDSLDIIVRRLIGKV